MNKEVSVAEKLAYEIYYNYLVYLSQDILISTCKSILADKNVIAFRNLDDTIVCIEKDDKVYVNTFFISVISDWTYTYINRDEKELKASGSIDSHAVHITVFIYLCLANKDFMKEFKEKYYD